MSWPMCKDTDTFSNTGTNTRMVTKDDGIYSKSETHRGITHNFQKEDNSLYQSNHLKCAERSNSITFAVANKKHYNATGTNCVNVPVNAYCYTNNSESIGKSGHNDEDTNDIGLLQDQEESHSLDSSNITEDSSDEGTSDTFCCGLTKRQLKVFLSLVFLSLNDVMGFSSIAPFFPTVAESKGLSAIEYGLIFSSYSVCGIVSSLITGTVLVKVGAKFCVLCGMFWNAGAIFCFGFVNQTSPTSFLILSILCRGLMGFGSNAAFTAMFAIIFQEFSDRAITVLSLSEALVGVGGMLAPLIGGGLYDLGGFLTPFMVLGSTQVLLLFLCWYMLPYVPIEEKIASRPPFYLLYHSSALLATAFVILIFIVNSFLVANIGPFLKDQFDMDATMVGVVLLVSSVFYAGMSPIWGCVTDRWKNSYLTELGTLGVACGMMLAGPAPFLRRLFGWSSQHLWLAYFSSAILGFFFGGSLMPTFNEMLRAATELNMGETVLVQYGLVSGLWNTGFAIGDVLGPTLGGVLVEHFDFQTSSMILAIACVVLTSIKLLHRFYRDRTRDRLIPTSDEDKPLLGDQNNGAMA